MTTKNKVHINNNKNKNENKTGRMALTKAFASAYKWKHDVFISVI